MWVQVVYLERELEGERVEKWKGGKPVQNVLLSRSLQWATGAQSCWRLLRDSTANTRNQPTKWQGNWATPLPYWEHEFPALPAAREPPQAEECRCLRWEAIDTRDCPWEVQVISELDWGDLGGALTDGTYYVHCPLRKGSNLWKVYLHRMGKGEIMGEKISVESRCNSEQSQEYLSILLIYHNQAFTFHFKLSMNHVARLMMPFGFLSGGKVSYVMLLKHDRKRIFQKNLT